MNHIKSIMFFLIFTLCGIILAQDDFQDDFNNPSSSETKTINISGTVTDAENGNALAGANVFVEGTDVGSATDGEGVFNIEGVEVGSNIIASMIGYADLRRYNTLIHFTSTK